MINWRTVKLKDVTVDVKSWDPSPEPEFTYVDISSIDNERCEIVDAKRLPGAKAPSRARRPVQDGDILFSNVRTYLRNVAHVQDIATPAVASTGFTLLRPTSELDSRFLYHLVRSDFFIDRVTPEQTGTHYPATSDRVVRGQEISLPPAGEQRLVANLIDRVESNRRSAASHICAARRAVDRFRQAVLAAACAGRLTAEWRAARGIEEYDHLPGGWETVKLASVARSIRGGSTAVPRNEPTEFPILRSSSVRPFSVDLSDVRYLNAEQSTREANYLQDDDLLITRLSGSLEYVGNCAVVRLVDDQRIQYPDRLFCCRLNDPLEAPFVQIVFAGREIRAQVEAATRSAAGHQRISISDLKGFSFTRPPLDEQAVIVRRVEQLLQLADGLNSRIDTASMNIERTSQAILAKAFRGELVGCGDSS